MAGEQDLATFGFGPIQGKIGPRISLPVEPAVGEQAGTEALPLGRREITSRNDLVRIDIRLIQDDGPGPQRF
jgi:hypothetical protein